MIPTTIEATLTCLSDATEWRLALVIPKDCPVDLDFDTLMMPAGR